MVPSAVRQFQEHYERLSGHVRLVTGEAEAAGAICSILKEAGVERVAVAALPDALERAVEAACTQAGIDVLAPPFDAAALPGAIDAVGAGITGAAFAVAEAGALVEVSTNDAVRLVSTLPRLHVGIVHARDVLDTLDEAAPRLNETFARHPTDCAVTFISGPSRSGDIAMQLTLGVHGPEIAHALVLLESA